MPLPHVSAGGQGRDTETGRSGGIHSHGQRACRLTQTAEGRNRGRENTQSTDSYVVLCLCGFKTAMSMATSPRAGSEVGREGGGNGHTGHATREQVGALGVGTRRPPRRGWAGGGVRPEELPGACARAFPLPWPSGPARARRGLGRGSGGVPLTFISGAGQERGAGQPELR